MRVTLAGILTVAMGALQAFATTTTYSAVHQQLIDLAAKNDGVVPLDAALFEKITASDREWSASVQFTAMQMKCAPCRSVTCPSSSALAGCSRPVLQHVCTRVCQRSKVVV